MKLNKLAQRQPPLSSDKIDTIKIGKLLKIQLTDGITDMFNETIVVRVIGFDNRCVRVEFCERQIGRYNDQSLKFKSPFHSDTISLTSEYIFAIDDD